MSIILTKELIGDRLDWAVAKATDTPVDRFENTWVVGLEGDEGGLTYQEVWAPSTDKKLAARLFKQYGVYWISNRTDREGRPFRWLSTRNFSDMYGNHFGPTPQIAGCRCLVAYKLGDVIDMTGYREPNP